MDTTRWPTSFEKDSEKNSPVDVPMSRDLTEVASMREIALTDSIESLAEKEPNWPRCWRAYTCWLGCFFLMFNSWGLVNAYGTFSSFYIGHSLRGNDQLELNLIGSTQSFLVLLFSAPVGRLLDAGHFRYVIGTGCLLVPLGMFLLSVVAPSHDDAEGSFLKIWITQGFVVGLGMACYFVSSSQVAATWFPNRKGLAIGFVACGASVAGVVYPAMTRYLISAMGFVKAVRLVSTLVTITSVFSLVFSTPSPKHSHPRPQSYRALKTWIDVEAFKNKAFVWFMIAVSFLFFGFYPVFFNLEEWAAVRGFGTRDGIRAPMLVDDNASQSTANRPLQTFWLLTIMNGASTVGRLVMASFSDKTGPLNMHIVAQLLCSGLILTLWVLAGSSTAAIAFCVAFGMTSGTVIGLPPASVANILGNTYNTPSTKVIAHSKLGQWTGMMYSAAAIPALTGPIISGHLISQYNTYITVQAWSGACLFLSAACMIIARMYLPCTDGENVGDKIKAWRHGRKSRSDFEDTDVDSVMAQGGLFKYASQAREPTVTAVRS